MTEQSASATFDGQTARRMPALFVGHGSPMNAIEDNAFARGWRDAAQEMPQPRAILCVSAHWETEGVAVTAMDKPRTIHDFGGFPQALYDMQYSAPGSLWLAQTMAEFLADAKVSLDHGWGLDHGCWSVLSRMYPDADVPVVQLSLDYRRSASEHYELARRLAPLRNQGVLILGSGNLVHNLRRIVLPAEGPDAFNQPYGLPWAIEANDLFKRLIQAGKHSELSNYQALGRAVQLAVPTPEHYLPMLYALALRREGEAVSFFNDQPVAGSLTMTSFFVG